MKNISVYLLVFCCLLFASCAQKHLIKGNYDKALAISVNKLKKNPDNEKYINILKESYTKANTRDNEKITFFKQEGQPDKWDEILVHYESLKRRQLLVRSLPEIPNGITFVDYNQEIIASKQKAAAYFYANGEKLLQQGGRENARNAYNDFLKIKPLFETYKDVDEKINEALLAGRTAVLFRLKNRTELIIPEGFERELLRMTVDDLNRKWVQFYLNEQPNAVYDYVVYFNLENIVVSPEKLKNTQYTDTKKVRDGWDYVLDKNGNVMKDTTGNDIKIEKYKTLTCDVLETQMFKSARVSGTVDFFEATTKEMIFSQPLFSEAVFNHFYAQIRGDIHAISEQTKEKLNCQPMPFPPSEELILQAADLLKFRIKDVVKTNATRFY